MKYLCLVGALLAWIAVTGIQTYRDIRCEHLRIQGEIIRRYLDHAPHVQQPSVEIHAGTRGA
jgi:hypothetical protein